jgi:GNAT superfamily N-acetyltransferase
VPDVYIVPVSGETELASFRRLLERYQDGLPEWLRVVDLATELKTLPSKYPAPSSALFLARAGNEDVGCVIASYFDAATIEVRRLYVEPAFRKSGAGRALVEGTIAFARSRSHRRIVLDTEKERLRAAYELYRRLGFVECAAYATAEYPNPTYLELVLTSASCSG